MTGRMGIAVSHHSCSWLFPSPDNFFLLQHVAPSMGQSFTNCSSMGPSYGAESFRNRLQQQGSPTSSLLQHGLSTGCRAVPAAFPHSSLTVGAQHFYPFSNIFSQRCYQHHCWAQLWPGAARASCKWLCPAQCNPWSFLREATPAVPPATKTLVPVPNTRS